MFIHSEIAPLKKVLLHRPEISLGRLTPGNCQQFLFDDVLWPEKAAKQHDEYAEILRHYNVEVLLLADLLTETLSNEFAREYLINQLLHQSYQGATIESLLRQYLLHLDSEELCEKLIGGLTYDDMKPYSLGLASKCALPYDFILPPLPNHLFTRDTSCWIKGGVSINSMAFSVRKPEVFNLSAIYSYHPLFREADFEIWYDGSDLSHPLPNIEGGDVLVISADCILVGLGERTQPQAVEILAKNLFQYNELSQIIVVELPKERASMHLDTVLTMIDEESFCVASHIGNPRSWRIRPGIREDDLVIETQRDFFKVLASALNLTTIRLIYPGGDYFATAREQWSDATNLLAIKPGTVIAYQRNKETNRKLKQEGIEVIPIHGSELSRGRGGARCMSCPILRRYE